MADVEVTEQPRFKMQRFEFTAVAAPLGMTAQVQLVVAVIQDGAKRLTDSSGAVLVIGEPFTARELVTGLRDLADDFERRLT